MKKIASLICLCWLMISCKYYAYRKYHVGQEFAFKQKRDFVQYLLSKKSFDMCQYLYLDTISYAKFVYNQLNNNPSAILFGTFLNDSISIRPSEFYAINPSCSGRIESELLRNLSLHRFPDSLLIKKTRLSDYQFRKLLNEEDFHSNAEINKLNIFLLYSYSYGSYYDKLYKKIQELQTHYSNTAKIFVVCTDPVYRLK